MRCYPARMSMKLSVAVGRVSRPGREADGECDGKTSLATAGNCIKLRDTRSSRTNNCTFLRLAIPGNFAPVSAPSRPLPFNSAHLHTKRALDAKTIKIQKVRKKKSPDARWVRGEFLTRREIPHRTPTNPESSACSLGMTHSMKMTIHQVLARTVMMRASESASRVSITSPGEWE
jgi:hypothetical protein